MVCWVKNCFGFTEYQVRGELTLIINRRALVRRRINKKLEFSRIPKSKLTIKEYDTNYDVTLWNKESIKVSKLSNGKINSNSVDIIRFFAQQVYENKPISKLFEVLEHSQLDVLSYSFETLPLSKEIYFKVKNAKGETLLAVKSSILRTSLIRLFGNPILDKELKASIKKIIEDVSSVIQIEENTICEAFSDFEFLIREKNAKQRLIILNETLDEHSILFHRFEFKRLSLSFGVYELTTKTRLESKVTKQKKVTFNDVYCMDNIIDQFKEIGVLIQNSNTFTEQGVHIPYGVLLVGDPGSGKTLITRAFANEYGIRIVEPKTSLGVEGTDQSIDWRATFESARYKKPSMVFIDEIDKIKITQELFYEMDGQIRNNGILVIATANDTSKIHPALFRPGRFDRKIYFQPLSNEAKAKMLLKVLEKNETTHNIDIDYLAEFMGNVNGAYIDTYVNEARIKMSLNGIDVLNNELLLTVIELVNNGYTMPVKVTDEMLEQTIIHEAGHAVVALALHGKEAVTKIDVRQNHYSLGRVQLSSKIPMHNQTSILNQVKISLGGIIAEKIILKEAGFGASSDIFKARRLLESMITDHGITDLVSSGAKMFISSGVYGTEKTKDAVIKLANEMMMECEKETIEIIQNNMVLLNEIVLKLKDKPLLLKDDIYELNTLNSIINHNSKNDDIYLNKA